MTPVPSTGRHYLTEQQYATDRNLAARQAIYRFQVPRRHLWNETLELAGLRGDETVLDVRCGNGAYLGALAQRRHRGLVVGMDLSPGMLAAALDEPRDGVAGRIADGGALRVRTAAGCFVCR